MAGGEASRVAMITATRGPAGGGAAGGGAACDGVAGGAATRRNTWRHTPSTSVTYNTVSEERWLHSTNTATFYPDIILTYYNYQNFILLFSHS